MVKEMVLTEMTWEKILSHSLETYKGSFGIQSKQYAAVRVLRSFRHACGLSVTDLSDLVGLSRSTIQRLTQYGVTLSYSEVTWQKLFNFVENLPPVQKRLL